MIDDECKKILMKKFDKEKNYKKIINHNHRFIQEKNGIRTISLISLFLFMIFTLYYFISRDNINKLSAINTINDENIENSLSNTIDEQNKTTNNEIHNNTEVVTNDNDKKKNTDNIEYNNLISKQEELRNNPKSLQNSLPTNENKDNSPKNEGIYKTIREAASFAKDPTIPENLISSNSYVLKVKILEIGKAEILKKQKNFNNPYCPYTPVKMQIIDSISVNKLSGKITSYLRGGKIKIGDLSKDEAINLGISENSDSNEEQYINYTSSSYYEPLIGENYIVIINKTNDTLYQFQSSGYGIFKIIDENYCTNVISNKEWKYK